MFEPSDLALERLRELLQGLDSSTFTPIGVLPNL